MIVGSCLNPVNSSLLAVALVPIGIAFGAPPAQTAWLVSALYLATAVGQPVIGRLVEVFGPRTPYLIATATAGFAGALGALAPHFGVLVVARILIGVGTCAGYPASMYLIRSEAVRTGKNSPAGVLSALSIANQIVAAIGPTLSGLLIGMGGWRTVFLVNVPLSAACLVLGTMFLPRGLPPTTKEARAVTETAAAADASPTTSAARRGALRTLDIPGMVLFTAALLCLMFFLMELRAGDWYLVAGAAVFGAAFVRRELRAPEPFIDLRLFAGNRPIQLTYLRQVLTCTVMYAFMYGFPQWLQAGRGMSPTAAGLMTLPMSAAAVLVTIWTGRSRQIRTKLIVGSAVQMTVCTVVLLMHAGSPIWMLAGVAVLFGIPQGLNGLANQNALYYQAGPDRMGSSAGLLRTFTYLGALISSAAIAATFGDEVSTAGMHELGWVLLCCATLLLAVVLVDRSLYRYGRSAPA